MHRGAGNETTTHVGGMLADTELEQKGKWFTDIVGCSEVWQDQGYIRHAYE
jgi:ABC-type polysaccharide transport system permease subunit